MKKTWIVFALSMMLAVAICVPVAVAETGYGTGDPDLDRALGRVDRAAREGVGDVARKIGREFDMPPEMVDWMLDKVGMSPGDCYMAAKVSRVAHRPVEEVVDAYRKNRRKGWGAIAREMGIRPGSAEFHALKAGADDFFGDTTDTAKGRGKGKGKSKKAKHKGKK